MVYNNNIPQPGDRPSASQSQLLGNFQDLKTYLDRNHVAISDPNSNVDEGKHIFLQMPEQASAPSTLANEGGLYTKEVSGATQLFFREESDGNEVQLTSSFLDATNGYYQVPGGLLIKWGQGLASQGGNTISFDSTIPFTTVYSVNISRVAANSSGTATAVAVGSFSNPSFVAFAASGTGTVDIHYIAVGTTA